MEYGAGSAHLHMDFFFFGADFCLSSYNYWCLAEAPSFIIKHILVNSTDHDKTVILLSS